MKLKMDISTIECHMNISEKKRIKTSFPLFRVNPLIDTRWIYVIQDQNLQIKFINGNLFM